MQRSQQNNSLQSEHEQQRTHLYEQGRPGLQPHPLLQQHPIASSLCLIGGALLLIITSFSADTLFPIFPVLGLSLGFPCLLAGIVLGISGCVAIIVGILEHLDHLDCVNYFPVPFALRIASIQRKAGISELSGQGYPDYTSTTHFKEHHYDSN